jgi:hypothetical protein
MSKKSKFIVAAAIAVLSLNSQAFAKGQPSPEAHQDFTFGQGFTFARGGTFHLNSYYQEAMAVGTSGGPRLSGGFEGSNVGGGFRSSAFVGAPPPVINNPAPVFNPSEPYTLPQSPETPVSPASSGSVFGNG